MLLRPTRTRPIRRRRHSRLVLAALFAAIALAACADPTLLGTAARADDGGREHEGVEHEDGDDEDGDYEERDERRARDALERGEILSLERILERADALLAGRMIDAELEREDGRWVYEITLLAADGHVVEALFDAHDAALLGLEGRNLEAVLKPPAE
ncbi:MAG: PepSY domain-containing protein [Azospirillaceae bacterium]